jgi:hypothetical protein
VSHSLTLCHPSMTNGICSDGYQDLHRADIEDIQFEIGGDVSGDSLGAETLFQDEVLHDEPGLELE